MEAIIDPKELKKRCKALESAEYITVDTEFLREKTYYPKLCLIQVAGPDEAFAVDPLVKGMDLSPLYSLFDNKNIMKVFHACKQDIEIIYRLAGSIPQPLFDSQVAAMVCGFGESVSYEKLVNRLADAQVDKSSRFMDWTRRPLTQKQLDYALSDVTHLRVIYEKLKAQLEKNNRVPWLSEEMATLSSPSYYVTRPEDVWKKIRVRSRAPRFMMAVRTLAIWRELEAQKRDLPRGFVMKDPVLLEVAASSPTTLEDLKKIRGFPKNLAKGDTGREVLERLAEAKTAEIDPEIRAAKHMQRPPRTSPMVELLRVLLKLQCEKEGVAEKMVATNDDLSEIAAYDNPEVKAMYGWRYDIFGKHALALKTGKIALSVEEGAMRVVERAKK